MSVSSQLRFAPEVLRDLAIAQEDARRLNSAYVGSEHLLIALLHDEAGAPAVALRGLGIEPWTVVSAAETRTKPATTPVAADRLLSNSFRQALESAMAECVERGAVEVSSEDLLIGLLRGGRSPASDILEDFGVTLTRLRERGGRSPGPETTDPAA